MRSGRTPVKLGLTGSIGMGKSTVADMFKALGVPVWDADEAVHRLYDAPSPLAEALTARFGDILTDGAVDRHKLLSAVRATPSGFDALNAIVHPAVLEDRKAFYAANPDAACLLSDIPLLFETGAENEFDKVILVTAPPEVQRARVLARPGMTDEKLGLILSRQMPDAEKRQRADIIIETSKPPESTRTEVAAILADLYKTRA